MRHILSAILLAAPTTSVAGQLRIPDDAYVESGTGVVEMSAVAGGRYIAWLDGNGGSLRVADTASADVQSGSACSTGSPSALVGHSSGRIFVGCDSGTLEVFSIDANGLVSEGEVSIGVDEISALAVFNDTLYAFQQPDAGNATWATLSIDTTVPTVDQELAGTIQSIGAINRAAVGPTGIGLATANGVEAVPTGTGGLAGATLGTGFTDLIAAGNTGFFVVTDDGRLAQYTGTSSTGLAVTAVDGVADASAIGQIDGEVVIADEDDRELAFFDTTGLGYPDSRVDSLSAPAAADFGSVVDIVQGDLNVHAAGTSQGFVWFITDGPWVQVTGGDGEGGPTGTTFDVTFTSDSAGSASVRLNGSSDTSGTRLAGPVDVVAGEEVTLSFEIDSTYDEGANELRVVVTDADGDIGRDIAYVTKDDPPEQVVLRESQLSFGNEYLEVAFPALDAVDVDKYVVFFTTEEFSADAYNDTGCADLDYCGPEFSIEDGPSSPIEITEWDGSSINARIEPLSNGTRYYIAVRAYDEGGQEGPMSAIISGVPRYGVGPAELAGEEGGVQCSTAAGASLFGLLVGLGAAVTRRRRWAAAGGALLLTAAVVPGAAEAKDPDAKGERKGHVEFRYGLFDIEDPNIRDVLTHNRQDLLWLEVGPHIIQQVEVKAGLGFFQEYGNSVLRQGGTTNDNVGLTALPLSLNATLRGDFWNNQMLVPAVGAGIEMWPWKQEPYQGSGSLSGLKTGWHWNAGIQLLLDRLDPRSASKFRVRTGVDDTYLTLEYRDQTVGDENNGLYYSGRVFGFGLKFDF